jgi:hypothetical protein
MPTALDNLNAAYANVAQQIADITANPQPTYSENGRSVSWSEYLSMLIDKQKALLQAIQLAGGPFEIPQRAHG